MSKRFVLTRRAVLKGIIGSTLVGLALPTLDAMLDSHGTAYANGSPLPRRFMSWFFGNGVRLDRFVPADQGQGSAWALTEELAPFANVKEYISVLSGFDNKAGYGRRGHHDGVAGVFSGYPFIAIDPGGANYASKFGGPSIDQQVVKRLQSQGVQTYLPSMHVGVSKRITTGEGPTLHYIAHKSPDESIESMQNPQDVYAQLFGNFVPKDDPEGQLRVKMLDAVSADAKRLKARVGKVDQARIDAHLDSISQLQKQIQALPPVCTKPGVPTETNTDSPSGDEPLEAVSNVMADLVALAWSCDITRVTTWQQSGSVGGTVYWMTGATIEEHGLSHDPAGQELVHQAVVFNMKCFAHLLETLKATPEGAGNVLDNSVILLGSDCAEGMTHSSFDQPIIVAGKGGGLLKSDLHYRSPNSENTSDILLTLLQTMDPSVTEVGQAEGYSNTGFGGIVA